MHTGISVAIPEGYAGLVLPRSGLAMRHGVAPVNTPGLIDSGYRGEIMIPLINHDPEGTFRVERGMRVAQLVLVRAEEMTFAEVESLEAGTDGRGRRASAPRGHEWSRCALRMQAATGARGNPTLLSARIGGSRVARVRRRSTSSAKMGRETRRRG